MIRQVVTVGPIAAASANNIAQSQTPTSGSPLTLNGSTVSGGIATLDVPRRVLLTTGSEASGRTLALTGQDINGVTLQETLVVPASTAGVVQSIQDFYKITKALPLGGGWTAAATLGTSSVASSPWQRVTEHITPVNISINCVVNGTANYTIETTNDSILAPNPTTTAGAPFGRLGPIPSVPTVFDLPPALTAQSANATGLITQPISWWRLALNSGSGSVTATAIQGGIIQGH